MTAWQDRLTAARETADAAKAAEQQAIRDASASGATPTQIAAALRVRNRQRVYTILAADPAQPDRPTRITPIAFMRGAGMNTATWQRAERALWARGFATTHERKSAWHICRGGIPLVLVDFSDSLDDDPPAPGGGWLHGYNRYVRVGLCRARYADDGREELVLVNGGDHYEPWNGTGHLDADMVARLAAEALAG